MMLMIEALCVVHLLLSLRHYRTLADSAYCNRTDQIGAWLGIVPRQNSSGGKASLGRISKRGDDYLRTLLIQGAKAAVMSAGVVVHSCCYQVH